MKRLINLLALLTLSFAQGQHKIELGYFGTTGNSDTTSLTAAYRYKTTLSQNDSLEFWSDILYASKNGTQSSERYRVNLDFDHKLSQHLYTFTQLSFLRNTFEGYNQQYNAAFGLGDKIITSQKHQLDILVGYQFRRNNYTKHFSENFNYAKTQIKYRYNLSKKNHIKFNGNAIVNIEQQEDYELQTTTDLILWIIDRLNFKLTFELKYDNLPPAGKVKTDTITKAAIVYSF